LNHTPLMSTETGLSSSHLMDFHLRTSWVFDCNSVFESYYCVKNQPDQNNFVWIRSFEDVSVISLPNCEVTTTFKGIWELEDTSRVLDPIQIVVLKKPPKLIALFKVKSESPSLPNKIMLKTIDLEKHKTKFYEIDALIPSSTILS
jgi:hypothetical protein